MTKQLTKQTIGVGVAGTGFIGPAYGEGLRRDAIQVPGILGSTKEKTEQRNGFILLSKNTRPLAENRRYLPPPNAEAAGSKMQNRMREEVILKLQG